jgi:hypothetical protein
MLMVQGQLLQALGRSMIEQGRALLPPGSTETDG